MRLDKYLANVSAFSRTEAKKLLKAKRVTVDGETAVDPRLDVSESAEVMVDGELLRQPKKRYFMLHKPEGYVSATKDREHLTVIDLIDEDNTDKLHIAGRLDIDTTGLVLISDDGKWSHQITSPKSHCKKTYLIETLYPLEQEAIDKIEQGIHLDNEKRPTLPAQVIVIDDFNVRLIISEGKYHQVKRMLAAVGNKVESLHRECIGNVQLDDELMPGEYRHLTPQELENL